MADIKLIKPQAGERITIQSAADARLEFAFSTADAVLEKSGNDLVFTFEDGSSVVLTDFYTAYTKETLPEFVVEGQTIAGSEFFAALGNDDLMPAAGPAATRAADGGRFHEYDESALMDGIDRLDGLDLGWQQQAVQDDLLAAGPGVLGTDGTDITGGADGNIPNEAPIMDADKADLEVTEAGVVVGGNVATDGKGTDGGTLTATDANGDPLNYGVQGGTLGAGGKIELDSPYGKFVLDPATGEYTYTLDNDASNSLTPNDTREETFTVTVSDGKGGTAEKDITVTIKGTNDAPVLTIEKNDGDDHRVKEDSTSDVALTASGTFTTVDVDSDGDVQNYSIKAGFQTEQARGTTAEDGHDEADSAKDSNASFTSLYGTLVLNMDGTYTFTLNNNSTATQSLAAGKTHTDQFIITVTDKHGATHEQTIEVKIEGTNDAPILTPKETTLVVKESGVGVPDGDPNGDGNTAVDGKLQASGKIDVKDVDVDQADPGPNFFFTVTLADGTVLDGKGTGNVFELEYGSLTINQDGTYTYTLNDDAVNALNQGGELRDDISVTVRDKHGAVADGKQDIKIVIEGTNDKPLLTLNGEDAGASHAITDPGKDAAESATVEGTVAIVDPDKGYEHSITITDQNNPMDQGIVGKNVEGTEGDSAAKLATAYGTLTVDPATGKYVYTLNEDSDAVRGLAAGEKHTEKFTVRVQDEHGAWHEQEIDIVVTGTNDRPVLVPVDGLTLNMKEIGVKDSDDWGTDKQGNIIQNEREGGKTTAEGKLNISDVDKGDSFQFYITYTDSNGKEHTVVSKAGPSGPFQTEHGVLFIYQDGTYKYTVSDTHTNPLEQGEIMEDDFTIHVKDKGGLETDKSQDVKVVIEGTNDQPKLLLNGKDAGASHSLTEPGKDAVDMSVGGKIGIVDPDHNASHDIIITDKNNPEGKGQDGHNEAGTAKDSVASFETAYGTLTVDPATGKYVYTIDSDSEAVRKLAAGEKYTEKFTVRVQDEHGAWHEQEIDIVITGTNDAPIVKPGGLEIQEDNGTEHVTQPGDIHKGGQVEASDAEGDKLRYNLMDEDGNLRQTLEGQDGGKYGYLTLNPTTGEYEYTLLNDSDAVQSLSAGQTITETFHVRVSDGKGGFTYQEITVTIEGANDKPTLTGNVAGVVEDGGAVTTPDGTDWKAPTTGGTLVIDDVDDNDKKSFELTGSGNKDATVQTDPDTGSMTIEGLYGTLTLNPDGTYTYTLTYTGEDLQGKNAGELFGQEKFDITWSSGTDTSKTQITIDITGSNDKPLLDVQEGDKGAVITSGVIHHNGTETGKVTADDIDDKEQDLTFHIMNQYDKDGNPKPGGSFEDTTGKEPAPGAGDDHWQPEQTGNGQYGSLTMNPDGTYSYTLNVFDRDAMDEYFKNNPNADSIKETFTITVTDPHGATDTKEITVEVPKKDIPGYGTGEGGVPEPDHKLEVAIEGTDPLKVGEDGTLNASGKVDIKVECDKDGAGHDGDHKGEFLFAFKDADGNYVQTISDQYGSITINPITGEYTYTLNNDSKYVQEMNEGETWKPELPPVYVVSGPDANGDWKPATDSNGKPVSGKIDVSIEGQNDAPEIDSVQNLSVNEDHTGTITGSVKAHDVDSGGEQGDSLNYDFSYKGATIGENGVDTPYGKLTVNADGSYSFTLDPSKAQSLGAGQDAHVKFTVSVTDEHGATTTKDIDVTIKGTNDAPTLEFVNAEDANLVFTEDSGTTSIKGQVKGEDVDEGDTLRYSITNEAGATSSNILSGACGTMVLNPKTGEYEYKLDPDSKTVQGLSEGEIREETYTITVSDGKGGTEEQTITITVKGTNDAPELSVTKTELSVIEDDKGMEVGTAIAFGKATATDVDKNDTLDYGLKAGDGEATYAKNPDGSVSVEGKYGTLTINADGTYTYTPTDAIQALGKGVHGEDKFTIFVDDHNGGLTEQEIKVDVTGSNDAPVVNADTSNIHNDLVETDDGFPVLEGKLDVDDPDGDKLSYSIADADKADFGTVVFNPDGTYKYTLNDGHQAQEGQQDSFTVTINDGHGGEIKQEITIDINPKAEQPEATAQVEQPEQAEQAATLSLFTPEGDESLYEGLGTDAVIAPLGFSGSAAYGTDDVAVLDTSDALMGSFAAELFPQDAEEDMDALLMNSLTDINATPLAADMAAAQTAPVEASHTPEAMDVAASVTPSDGMNEATDMAAHKIMLENNG